MSSLIVFLATNPAAAGHGYDYVLTHDGESVAAHGRCSADLLPSGGEVVGVLAVDALSWHSVRLPKGALSARAARHTPRLRAALDALLEDNLLDEGQQLHLALAPQSHGEGLWQVAVCDKTLLQSHQRALEQAGRALARIVPELEPGPAQWVALQSNAGARLATVSPDGVVLWPLDANGVRLAGGAADAPTPLTAEPACAGAAEAACQRNAALQQREQRWLQATRSAWDLAQFELLSSAHARRLKRLHQAWQALVHAPQWRLARWGVAALLLVQVVGLNAWAWHERGALRQLRADLQQTLTQTFPGVRTVIDAPVQMERELEVLKRASGAAQPNDLESLLANLAKALPAGRSASALDYEGGTLRVRGLRLSADERTAALQQLQGGSTPARSDGDDLVLGGGKP